MNARKLNHAFSTLGLITLIDTELRKGRSCHFPKAENISEFSLVIFPVSPLSIPGHILASPHSSTWQSSKQH